MRFVPYNQTRTEPNVIVDGAGNDSTVLTLSHWPKSGTPVELKADTSAAIVFKYLDSPAFHADVDAVSNNHFDEDGLIGIFALLDREAATTHRDLLIDIAQAGDFGLYTRRHAARIAFIVSAFANPKTSPFPQDLFELPYADLASALYMRLLDMLPGLLAGVDGHRKLWEEEDANLTASEALIDKGLVTIEERPALDLAIVRLPEDLPTLTAHRFTAPQLTECHPYAIHNRTTCTRVLLIQGRRVELQYRYESWVQLASRRPPPRVDLSPLATELNAQETNGRWAFDGVDQITPSLRLEGSRASAIPVDTIVALVERHLTMGPGAWDPYD